MCYVLEEEEEEEEDSKFGVGERGEGVGVRGGLSELTQGQGILADSQRCLKMLWGS